MSSDLKNSVVSEHYFGRGSLWKRLPHFPFHIRSSCSVSSCPTSWGALPGLRCLPRKETVRLSSEVRSLSPPCSIAFSPNQFSGLQNPSEVRGLTPVISEPSFLPQEKPGKRPRSRRRGSEGPPSIPPRSSDAGVAGCSGFEDGV